MKRYSVLKIIGLLLPALFLIVQPVAGVNAQTAAPLTIDQLLNASIPNFATDPNQTITLDDGKFGGVDGENYFIGLNTGASTYTVGDFNNDGLSDIAATIGVSGGGSGFFTYLVIFTNNNGTPQYLTATELGDRITLNQVSYDNGVFSADIITQGPNDPMCCGTLHETVQYQLENGSLVAVNNPSDTAAAPTNNNALPTPINSQIPIPSSPTSPSSTDYTQWIILGGLALLVLFIISFTFAKRSRARKIAEGRNPNTANAIYLAIIGIAFFFAENEFSALIGFIILIWAWRLYAKGKPKLKDRTTGQDHDTSYSNEEASSSHKNETQEPVKKRRSRDDPEMKALYRKLMHKYHPDRGQNKEEDGIRNDITTKINKAYREGDFDTLKLFE